MAFITPGLEDNLSLSDFKGSDRVKKQREYYFAAAPEICIERPKLVTEFSIEAGLFEKDKITTLDKARVYRKSLEKRKPIVWHSNGYQYTDFGLQEFPVVDTSPFAGSTTTKFKGVPIYPEFLGLTIWPELRTIGNRKSNPYHIQDHEVEALNLEIFPHWMNHNIFELGRVRAGGEDLARIKLYERIVFFLATKPECISHTIPDFTKVLNIGLKGIFDLAERGVPLSGAPEADEEFYLAVKEVVRGIIAYSRNVAEEAERMARVEFDPERKRELERMAAIYRRVPEHPAGTFREGLTSIWTCWTAIHLENPNLAMSLGRLDQFLYNLYRKDIEEERLDLPEAIDLLCHFWLKIGDHVPMMPNAGEQLFGGTGSNQAITIGGVDPKGEDAVNDLTYLILRATEIMKLRDPNLNARYYKGINSQEYFERCCEVNLETRATPALHNDRAVIKALRSKGETLEQARDYGIIGCVEPGSNGRFYGHSASILFNLTSALELALFNGKHRHTRDVEISPPTGNPTEFETFEAFWNAFETQTCWLIEQATKLNNFFGTIHQEFYPTPTLSTFFEGPMEKGKDLIEGGAVINSSAATIIGLADVADSLAAIENVVFGEGLAPLVERVPFHTLIEALENNFEGHSNLLERLRNQDKVPKYGNDDPRADAIVRRLLELLDRTFGAIENYRGGHYRVGYWTMTNHAGFGRLMMATPNGRKARENFTSGITPVSKVTPFLTKTLNSAAGLPAEHLSSGVALNIKFTERDGDRKTMLRNFVSFVHPYFGNDEHDGGFEIQFNVISHQEFIDAAKHPDNYQDLLVRVSGYTAYFKDLNPQMQKEIIDRTEYRLSNNGREESYPWFPLKKIQGGCHV